MVLMVALFVTIVQVNYWFAVELDHFLVASVLGNFFESRFGFGYG
jgi:hypothetical protein